MRIRKVRFLAGQMHPSVFLHLTRLRGIQQLALEDVEFPSPASFAALICSFPTIVCLECVNVRVRHYTSGIMPVKVDYFANSKLWASRFSVWLCTDDISAKPLAAAIRRSNVLGYIPTLTPSVGITLRDVATSGVGSLLHLIGRLRQFKWPEQRYYDSDLHLQVDCRGTPMHTAVTLVGKYLLIHGCDSR